MDAIALSLRLYHGGHGRLNSGIFLSPKNGLNFSNKFIPLAAYLSPVQFSFIYISLQYYYNYCAPGSSASSPTLTESKEVGSPEKQEGTTSEDKIAKASSSSSTPWLRLKDPRIVRVSRAFGGKDRHSKVCTIRGLRDRRVRLSVPTAIQLYDLQDRLGLNQPSKVVDWLLNAAKDEIDELPPLPIPPGSFSLNHQAMLGASLGVGISQQPNKDGFKMNNNRVDWDDPGALPQPNFWTSDAFLRAKSKQVVRDVDEKQNWTRANGGDKEDKDHESNEVHDAQVSSSNLLHRGGHSSSQGLINNAMPYGSFFHLENPNFQFSSQAEDLHNLNAIPFPSNLSLSSGSSVLLRPPTVTQSYFPSNMAASMEIDPRQISQFQMLAPSTQNLLSNSITPAGPFSMRPFHFSVTPRSLNSPSGSQPDKEREFPLK
ncbi:hypothetical protein Tsubulata_019417 [Turnera subulata]|uniref:TCP domain-containing protein n=1 Tax=Turnera subulata TaxID=218843 RepID=A0A9Q0G179_9ROSI|nr:hypothetical protein Tsubulata_019417 [Turnera subulata]